MIDWNTIALAIIALAGTTITAVMTYFMAKLTASTKRVEENSAETKAAAQKTAEETVKITDAVNGKSKAAIDEIRMLREAVSALTTEKAVLMERENVKAHTPTNVYAAPPQEPKTNEEPKTP